jgi:hypothetical protein
VLPDISVLKEADDSSFQAVGGLAVENFTPDQTFLRSSGGGGGGSTPIFAGDTCDDAGPNDVPDQTDLNCFTRADNVAGRLWLRWTWDAVTGFGNGQSGDACALLDTDNNSKANYAFCVRITNPTPTTIGQFAGSPILYKCKDVANSGEFDRCASKTSIVTLDASSICTVSKITPDALPGGEEGSDAQAECDIRLADLGQNVATIDLLNVCSFPSGSPNSNPFDCVVTPQAGFLVITKSTTPTGSDAVFGYVLRNAANTANATATTGDETFGVQSGATSAAIPILPGTYAVQELMPSGWNLDTNGISCTRDGASVGSLIAGTTTQGGVTIVQGQTTTCTFANTLTASQTITFYVTVTNNSLEAVTLFSLEDSENPEAGTPTYATLSGVGTCNSAANPFGSIAGNGGTYTCSFTRVVSGSPGSSHKDRVRAVGKDNENNSDTETSDILTISITP